MQPNEKKILIVDDHEFIHDILDKMFTVNGYISVHAFNGKEGVEKVEAENPDLIIMDQMMPVMDGLSATKIIRKKHDANRLPIIFFTAKNDRSTLVEVLNAGANDYITKPFEKEELIARVSAHLRIRTLQGKLEKRTIEFDNANKEINSLNKEILGKNRILRKRVYDLNNLLEVSIKFLSELNYDDVIHTSLLTILGLFSVKFVSIAINEGERNVFTTKDIKGLENDEKLKIQIKEDDEIIQKLYEKRTPFNIESEVINFNSPGLEVLKKIDVDMLAPLIYKNNLMGILILGKSIHKQHEEGSYKELLGVLANLISVALLNANLYDKVKAMSYKDGMTGLHNYRFFEMRLKEEVLRAKRDKTEVHLLILDVDYFKNYNDSLGHLAGDEVLRKLGGILFKSVRQNDIACRYGGEEFAIILPAISRKNAEKVSQRLRKTIEKAPFPDEYVQPDKRITVSIGLASVPKDADDPTTLVKLADIALYQAKESGRNKMIAYKSKKNKCKK